MRINPFLYRQNLLYFLFILFGLAGIQALAVVEYLGLPASSALADASVTWSVLGLFVFFITNTLFYFHPRSGRVLVIAFAPLVLAFLWFKTTTVMGHLFISYSEYHLFIRESGLYRFTVAFLILLATTIISLMWYRLGEKEDAQRRKEEMEKLARDAELFKLRQQLQPHFLFNSLNSINSLIGSRPQEARAMVQQLSDFLRGTLKREDQKLISLQEELEYLKLYLDIEQVRFGHRLRVNINCDDEARPWKLPPLILQPILENAIKFGVYGTTSQLEIHLRAEISDGYLLITASNPFDEDAQMSSGTGFGLKSVQRRLYLLYARTDMLETTQSDHLFSVQLKIPKTL